MTVGSNRYFISSLARGAGGSGGSGIKTVLSDYFTLIFVYYIFFFSEFVFDVKHYKVVVVIKILVV